MTARRRTESPAKARRARRLLLLVAASIVLAVAVAAMLLSTRGNATFSVARDANRNVLLVTIDTLRADALGSYGGAAQTPNLDRLADRGARFSFAHSHAVLTLPSHTSILTGRYPYEHGIRDNTGFRVRQGEVTLAGRLKNLGFATGAFVSAFTLDQRYGLNAGFDLYDDAISEVGRTTEVAVPERRADATVTAALRWLSQQSGKWFGWVHVFDPHAPYSAPPEWRSRYPQDQYAAEVAWTDFALGPLFARLEKESRPTLVIVTSDHGEGLGDHGEMTHGIFAYEATLHVPLIVAEIRPGAKSSRSVTVTAPARHIDIVPTVLDAVGQTAGATDLPGSSLLSDSGRGSHDVSYFESMMPVLARGWAPLRGVLLGREKYIDLPIAELYDLDKDSREQQNLAAGRGDRVTVLLNLLHGFNMDPPGQPTEEATHARERLRALGYTSGSPAPMRDRYSEADDPKRLIDLDQMLHRASDAFLANRPADAIALYQQVIARRADTADAYRYLAFVRWETGDPSGAIATLELAIKNGVAQRDITVKLGTYLAETGSAAKAIALLETLPRDDTEALNALGIAYGHAGRFGDAMKIFERAIALDQTNGLANQNIGTLYLRAGNVAAAEASVRRAITIDPSLAGAHTTLGVILSKTGRRQEAIDAWKRAVDLEPTEFDAMYNLAVELAAAGRMDEARTYGTKYINSAPPALYAADIAHLKKLLER
jgi:arylsulfatase A-like enzyme/tetratricopeptide (TPR) repeat protein